MREAGGLFTLEDLANWKVNIEEPVHSNYRGIEVYKLTTWVQRPVMLQTLNILENFDLKSMGYDSARYIHTLYQAMNLAYADRDFYYGDPDFSAGSPIKGLLSKDYARERAKLVRPDHNDPDIRPGRPLSLPGRQEPLHLASSRSGTARCPRTRPRARAEFDRTFRLGTTSVEAADEKGWAVSVTPSGGWMPAVIAGHTGIGLSQRMQSFVLEAHENPYNVLEPGQAAARNADADARAEGRQARAHLLGPGRRHPGSEPAAVLPERGRVRHDRAGSHRSGQYHELPDARLLRRARVLPRPAHREHLHPAWVRAELTRMGYRLEFEERSSGPINAIRVDREHGTFWGGSSNHGEDYGIGW